MPPPQNIVGPRIKLLRRERGLTQSMLAARCGLLGWDIGENVVTKIETRVRCVTDAELICLAKALNTDANDLLPPKEKMKSTVTAFFSR
jgi:transcriptional regulator with XRE-family HTH domain